MNTKRVNVLVRNDVLGLRPGDVGSYGVPRVVLSFTRGDCIFSRDMDPSAARQLAETIVAAAGYAETGEKPRKRATKAGK